jgi:hypothetical protein
MRGNPILSRCVCGAKVLRPNEGERPIPMEHRPFCTSIDAQKCEWCGGPMWPKHPDARCCQGKCKAALWKHVEGYGSQKPRKTCTNTKTSGFQYPRRRAINALAVKLAHDGMGWKGGRELVEPSLQAVQVAERILDSTLSTRQREQLNQRSEREAA